MTAIVLPVAARAALRAVAPSAELVARPSGLLHLYAGQAPGLRDFTLNGVLRRPGRPVCGRSAPRWYLHEPDGRRLCGHCAAWARRNLSTLERAPVSIDEIVSALDTARQVADVEALQALAIARGLVARTVYRRDANKPVPLHTVIRQARLRLTPFRIGTPERNWLERRPASRYPRRSA